MEYKKGIDDIDRFTAFVRGYVEAGLWASPYEDGGRPLDYDYSYDDLTFEAMVPVVADCKAFYDANAKLFEVDNLDRVPQDTDPDHPAAFLAGVDFWLSRNGSEGFSSGNWKPDVGRLLSNEAASYGFCYMYRDGDFVGLE